MNRSIQLTDSLLAEALGKRAGHGPSPMLLTRVVSAAASLPQERPTRRWLGGQTLLGRPGQRLQLGGLAGVLASAIVIVFLANALIPPVDPGRTPAPSRNPSPSPSSGATIFVPTVTPEALLVGDAAALRIPLGNPGSVGPNDVLAAFESVWVANLLSRDVRRIDPLTMQQQARIAVNGPGWFAVADGAVWATNQGGTGISRIDPVTNTVVDVVGDGPPCGAPVIALGDVWVSACDADAYYRIEPQGGAVDTVEAAGRRFIALAGGQLIVMSTTGPEILDPDIGSFQPVPGDTGGEGLLIGGDAESFWLVRAGRVERIDPGSGAILATFAHPRAGAITFTPDRAWLTVPTVGIVEIDLETNAELRTLSLTNSPHVAREAEGLLWVTDFANDRLWRIEP